MTIGLKRDFKIPVTPGPGEYKHDKADPIVYEHHRQTEFFHNGRKEVKIDAENGPGTHDEHRNFGYDSKDMTIGLKKDHKIPVTPGPGEYKFERANNTIYEHHRENEFYHNGRKDVKLDPNNGPGTHEEHRNFGYDSKDMTIGQKRDHKIEVKPGPGYYRHEQADTQVYEHHRANEFFHNGRKEVKLDAENGPGTHEEHRNFGYDTKELTIGQKREHQIPKTPGPGEYNHEQADKLVF